MIYGNHRDQNVSCNTKTCVNLRTHYFPHNKGKRRKIVVIKRLFSLDFYILLGLHLTLLTRYPFLPKNYKSYCALAMGLKYKLFVMDLKWILEKLPIKNGERVGYIFNGRWKGLDVFIISGWQGWKFPWSSNTLRLIILCMIMRISLCLLNLSERKWLWSATWLISPKREAGLESY